MNSKYGYNFTGAGSRSFTTSAGIFRYIPLANGKGLKKKGAFLRIKGYTSDPSSIESACKKVVSLLNCGKIQESDFQSKSIMVHQLEIFLHHYLNMK